MNTTPSSNQPKQHELSEQVGRCLVVFPPAQCQLVEMAFLQGMSQHEIASKLSLPLATIKARIELAG